MKLIKQPLPAILICLVVSVVSFFGAFSYGQPEIEKANIQVMTLPLPMDKTPRQVRQNFRGYRVIISNMGNTDIQIEKALIKNGYDGETIYRYTRGKVFQWSSLKSLGISSLKQANRNHKIRHETRNHPNLIKPGPLHAGDFVEAITFVPTGHHPKLSILYRDNRTGNLHEFQRD